MYVFQNTVDIIDALRKKFGVESSFEIKNVKHWHDDDDEANAGDAYRYVSLIIRFAVDGQVYSAEERVSRDSTATMFCDAFHLLQQRAYVALNNLKVQHG